MSSAAAATLSPPSVDDELTALKRKLAEAKADLKKWSTAVESAAIGSAEEAKAKEQQMIYLQRVTSLEQQIAGEYSPSPLPRFLSKLTSKKSISSTKCKEARVGC